MAYTCRVCGEQKNADDFRRGPPKQSRGKPCRICEGKQRSEYLKNHPDVRDRALKKYNRSDRCKEAQQRYRDAHAEEIRKRWREWYERNKEKEMDRQRHRRKTDSAKTDARNAVAYALRIGRIVKGACEVCGAEKTEAHHEDYAQPLKVNWLCTHHHKIKHGKKP